MAEKIDISVALKGELTKGQNDFKTLQDKQAFEGKGGAKTLKSIQSLLAQLEAIDLSKLKGKSLTEFLNNLGKLRGYLNSAAGTLTTYSEAVKKQQEVVQDARKKLDAARSNKTTALEKKESAASQLKLDKNTFFNKKTGKQVTNVDTIADLFEKGSLDIRSKTGKTSVKDQAGKAKELGIAEYASASAEVRAAQIQVNNATIDLNKATEDFNKMPKEGSVSPEAQAVFDSSAQSANTIEDIREQVDEESINNTKKKNEDLEKNIELVKKQETSLGKAFKQFTLYSVAIRGAKQALNEAKQTIKELDKYLTEQAMVTGKSREETYKLVGQYQELALQCGATTKEIAQVTTEYMKQGKSTDEALVLTEAAVKAAKVARVSVGDSVNYLTTALNGFRLEATEAMRVSDIFASVAAASATDYDELAIALSKVASQANLAGMSIEYTTALLTKGLETTREAPETMGTALKTIIARMREMSDYGETLEGDTDINNVESQLAYVGIALKNEQGELRSTEEVLDELGQKWDTLNKNQQAALAKALAGTRQQSRLIAMMDDYERVIELQETAERSTGATSAQAGVYLEGMEASLNKIQVAWEKIIMTVTDSEIIIGVVSTIASILEGLGNFLDTGPGMVAFLTTASIIGLNILGVKIRENKIAKENNYIQSQINLNKLKERKTESDIALIDKRKLVTTKKEAVTKLEGLKTTLLEKKAKGQITPEEEKQLKTIDARIAKAQNAVTEAEQELKIEEARNRALDQNIKLQETQTNNVLGLKGAWSGITGILGTAFGIIQGIAAFSALILKLKKKEGKETDKNTAKTLKQAAAEKIKAAFGMAGSASTNGPAGWIIAAGILALMIGLTIGHFAAANAAYQDSAEGTSERINKLSNEIYKLNESANAINNVTNQFDALDNKVLKTKEDIAEMNSLLESAGDNLSTDEDAQYNQAGYEALQDNASKRRYLELAEESMRAEANKLRQQQLQNINGLSSDKQVIILNDNTNNSKYLETQSAIRAIVNNTIYETIDALKELGTYTDEELEATETLTIAFMEETKALEALDYANNSAAVSDLVSDLVKLDATMIFNDESNSITKRVNAFREIQNALADDEAALEALNKAYSEWNTFSQMSDDLLDFIEVTSLSIDQLNELYAGYSKLQKAGIDITKDQYQKALEETMFDLDDNLSNFKDIVAMHFGDMIAEGNEFADQWNAIVSAIGDTFATGILDMGQNMEKFQNTINSFYEKSAKWAEMKESEKMEFISDNADLFAGEGGQEMLAAFESGDYNTIEAALRTQMEDRLKTQLAEVQRTLAVEEARVGEDRNEAYIASLREYEKYLLDGNKLYKASLDLRLEQEKNQLDKYKEYLEKQQEALTESLEKRKEAYEKYFEDINQEQDDADYEEDANRLITNISKLSSSTNADAMQKTAELEQELRDLEEERLKELRERAQEAVIENIDTTIEEINDKFDKLLESNQALLHAMQGDLNNPLEFMTDMIMTKADDGLTALEMQQYIQDLQGTYGSVIGNEVFENMTVREDGDHLILNISGQEVVLGSNDQQSVYLAIMEALRAVGLK